MTKEQLIHLFNQCSKKVRKRKKVMGAKFREHLLRDARGKTLEVAIGAGANFGFYPKDIELVAVDFSPVLLEMARERARSHKFENVTFVNADVEFVDYGENSFDTIVSTMTLCVYDDPVRVLHNFNRWCKPDGKILLFEHGIGSFRLLNWFLNRQDRWNYENNGCHLNLDMKRLVYESGLIVEETRSSFLGTHHIFKARPNKECTDF